MWLCKVCIPGLWRLKQYNEGTIRNYKFDFSCGRTFGILTGFEKWCTLSLLFIHPRSMSDDTFVTRIYKLIISVPRRSNILQSPLFTLPRWDRRRVIFRGNDVPTLSSLTGARCHLFCSLFTLPRVSARTTQWKKTAIIFAFNFLQLHFI